MPPVKKRITPAERRHQDHLRRKTLKVASVYEARLEADRRKELRRVLNMARDYDDPIALVPLIESEIDETKYLGKWWKGLIVDAGLPIAQATARDLRAEKAALEDDIWLAALRTYATTRAGTEIRVVTGTWKDTLVRVLRQILADDLAIGIEKATKELYRRYTGDLEKWMCRRIAQTEAMIGMAEAANDAAKTLSIPYTKEWCISGLGNTRASHELMDGVRVDEDEPFSLPGGMLMYPHDTSLGADGSEIINCACACIRRPKNNLADEPGPEPVAPPEPQLQEPAEPDTPATPEDAQTEARIQALMAEMDQSLPEETRRAIAENDLELEKALGVKKGAPMTVEKADEQSANPKHVDQFIKDPKGPYVDKEGNHYIKNPDYKSSDAQYSINCATCSPTFMLRERGFDITARGNIEGSGSLNNKVSYGYKPWDIWKNADGTKAKPTTVTDWMRGKQYEKMTAKRYKEYYEDVTKQPGTYEVVYGRKKGSGGHATILKRSEDGKLYYIEPQVYDKDKGVLQGIDHICSSARTAPRWFDGVMRLDDKLFDTDWAGLFSTK